MGKACQQPCKVRHYRGASADGYPLDGVRTQPKRNAGTGEQAQRIPYVVLARCSGAMYALVDSSQMEPVSRRLGPRRAATASRYPVPNGCASPDTLLCGSREM